MLEWLKTRARRADPPRAAHGETGKPPRHVTRHVPSGKYLLLYEYLEHRYADTVVLTFAQIEDLLGVALPDQARRDRGWWTDAEIDVAGTRHSDCWTLAERTATPNLTAQIVAFERVPCP